MTHLPQQDWWLELNTWEPKAALTFYRQALGWEFEPAVLPDGACYWVGRKHGKPVGGVYVLTAPAFKDVPPHWMTYLTVNDMEQAQDEAVQLGGQVLRPALQVPGIGHLALLADSAGALIGLFQPDSAHALRAVH